MLKYLGKLRYAIIMTGVLTASALLLGGCGTVDNILQSSDTPTYKEAETLSDAEINKTATDIVAEASKNKSVPYTLDPDFVVKNLGVENFDEDKARIEQGISATQNVIGLTKAETELWIDIIENEKYTPIATDSVYEKAEELNSIINEMVEQSGLGSKKEFLLKEYSLDENELEELIQTQAAKFLYTEEETSATETESAEEPSSDLSKTTITEESTTISEETTEEETSVLGNAPLSLY